MIQSLYTAGNSMLVQTRKMNVLTNNIANIETAGAKRDVLLSRSFSDVMIERKNDPNILNTSIPVGEQNYGIHIDEVITDFSQGVLEETNQLTDCAIVGNGFFVVNTPQGQKYTRDGCFMLNADGNLTNQMGYPIQGQNGDVKIGTSDFKVKSDGSIQVEKNIVDQIKIVDFANLDELRKDGNNLFMNFTNQAVQNAEGYEIRQGYLEGSNIDVAEAMVDMIEISRTYELNQKVVQMLDESLDKAVNSVGRV